MSKRTLICLTLACLAVGLLAAGAYADVVVRLSGFPGITQIDCNRTCGAACCQMCTKWIPGNTCPSNQETVYSYCHANNREAWAVDPQGESYGLWNYTPNGFYYSHWHYTSATGAIRGTCYTIEQYNEGVPVVIRSAAHWVVMRGFGAYSSVVQNYGTSGALVYGVRINDPLYPSCCCYVGAWDTYFSASTWANNYFNNCGTSGTHWANTRASAERDVLANLHGCMWNSDSFANY